MVDPEFALRPVERLRPHEETVDDRVTEIAAKIRADGQFYQPIVVDRETDVVLDGHHRLAALKRLDCELVPVHLVEYADEEIVVDSWSDDEDPPSKEEVVDRATAGDRFPPRTTRHRNVKEFERVSVDLAEIR